MVAANIVVAIAVGLVACVLMAGVYTLWVGGDVARSWSNRLMRIRILAQLVAVIIIVIVFYVMRRH
ncbi:MAG TPA: twin transmembrane helix small protein [Rhizomicrobium sp.]|nr:twin transmembrane helix small protein [Rhizomicrobium sp.]